MDLGNPYVGAVGGLQQVDQQRALAPFQVPMAKAELANQLMGLQYKQAQTEQLQRAMAADKTLAGYAFDTSKSPSANLAGAGLFLAKQGFGSQALQMMEKASLEGQREEHANYWRAFAEQRQTAQITQMHDYVARLAPQIHSQADLDQVKANIQSMFPGARVPELDQPYSPEMVKMLAASGISAKDQAVEEQRARTDAARLERSAASLNLRRAEFEFRQQVQADKEARADAKAKAAADKAATKQIVDQTSRWLKLDPRFEGMDPTSLSVLGEAVAEKVDRIRKANPAVNVVAARHQALNDPDIQSLIRTGKPGMLGGLIGGEKPRVETGKTGPKLGDVQDGWRYKGGDPSKKESWEQVK